MASFDSVNYSIRPSKSVQRGIVFQGLRRIFEVMDLSNAIYAGFRIDMVYGFCTGA